MARALHEPDDFDTALGARLRKRREQLKISQAALGRALGKSYQQIQKYKSGANRLSGATLVQACRLLRLPVEQLLWDADDAVATTPRDDAPGEPDALFDTVRRISAGPLRSQALRLIEALATLSDMQKSQAALAAETDLLAALPFAIYTTNADGLVTYFNDEAAVFAGRKPRLMQDRWCVTWRLYKNDGAFLPHDECPMAIALKEDRAVRGVSAVAEAPDGRRRRFAPHPTPLHGASGALIGGINLFLDLGPA